MKTSQAIALIKAHKGKIFVDCNSANDSFYVQVTKAAILESVKAMPDNEIEIRIDNKWRELYVYRYIGE